MQKSPFSSRFEVQTAAFGHILAMMDGERHPHGGGVLSDGRDYRLCDAGMTNRQPKM
jgi:hypothetical protein